MHDDTVFFSTQKKVQADCSDCSFKWGPPNLDAWSHTPVCRGQRHTLRLHSSVSDSCERWCSFFFWFHEWAHARLISESSLCEQRVRRSNGMVLDDVLQVKLRSWNSLGLFICRICRSFSGIFLFAIVL
jgi:hypothetical protein